MEPKQFKVSFWNIKIFHHEKAFIINVHYYIIFLCCKKIKAPLRRNEA